MQLAADVLTEGADLDLAACVYVCVCVWQKAHLCKDCPTY